MLSKFYAATFCVFAWATIGNIHDLVTGTELLSQLLELVFVVGGILTVRYYFGKFLEEHEEEERLKHINAILVEE